MKVSVLFPSKYVKAVDLNGRDVVVTIKAVILEEMGNPHRKPEIDETILPLVACMIHPDHNEGSWFARAMIDELWESQSIAAIWAIQTIAELQCMYIEATDKLSDIEAIVCK